MTHRRALRAVVILAVSLAQTWVGSPLPANDDARAPRSAAAARGGQPTNKPSEAQSTSPIETDIVIARHVLLMDGEIVNWQQASSQLRILRKDGPVRAHFHFTNGVVGSREKGADFVLALHLL